MDGFARGRFLVLKGWVFGVDGPYLHKYYNAVCNMIKRKGVDTIVWDGDKLSAGSFTCAIPLLMERLPNLKALIFKKDKSVRELASDQSSTVRAAAGSAPRAPGWTRAGAERGAGRVRQRAVRIPVRAGHYPRAAER